MIRSPITYFGGKGRMRKKILPHLEKIEHRIYVEPFGGGANVILGKHPKPVEVYNDIDKGLYDFFKVLQDPDLFDQFHRRICVSPYHREIFNDCRAQWANEPDLIKRVSMWYVVARQSFGGEFGGSFSTAVNSSYRGMVGTASKFLGAIDNLPNVVERLRRVQIENQDWRTILKRYDTADTLFYLDPPYTASTRRGGKYSHEITDQDHVDLVDTMKTLTGSWVLSGYDHKIYSPLIDHGAEVIKFEVSCSAAGCTKATGILGKGATAKNQKRTECLWVFDNTKEETDDLILYLWGLK